VNPLPESIPVYLDAVTAAILRKHASARRQTISEVAATILYRQAATMTGWPGPQGADLERAMLNAALPVDADDPEL
jgi:hypothetical protein